MQVCLTFKVNKINTNVSLWNSQNVNHLMMFSHILLIININERGKGNASMTVTVSESHIYIFVGPKGPCF